MPALQSVHDETFDVLPVAPKLPGAHCTPRHAPSPAVGAHVPEGQGLQAMDVDDGAPSIPTEPATHGEPTQLKAPAEVV